MPCPVSVHQSELKGLLQLLRAAAVRQLEMGGRDADPFGFKPTNLAARGVSHDA